MRRRAAVNSPSGDERKNGNGNERKHGYYLLVVKKDRTGRPLLTPVDFREPGTEALKTVRDSIDWSAGISGGLVERTLRSG